MLRSLLLSAVLTTGVAVAALSMASSPAIGAPTSPRAGYDGHTQFYAAGALALVQEQAPFQSRFDPALQKIIAPNGASTASMHILNNENRVIVNRTDTAWRPKLARSGIGFAHQGPTGAFALETDNDLGGTFQPAHAASFLAYAVPSL